MKDLYTPTKKGTTCPALDNENYKYHLSEDCDQFCKCMINNRPCVGRNISDPDNQSSDFFSRAKCQISISAIGKCPLYGLSSRLFVEIIREKTQLELEKKLSKMGVEHV